MAFLLEEFPRKRARPSARMGIWVERLLAGATGNCSGCSQGRLVIPSISYCGNGMPNWFTNERNILTATPATLVARNFFDCALKGGYSALDFGVDFGAL
jgi:hypothetical protein